MRSQLDRDQQTVTIATTLGIFVLALLLCAGILWLVELTAGPPAGVRRLLSIGALVAAASISLTYLARNRRP